MGAEPTKLGGYLVGILCQYAAQVNLHYQFG